MLPALPAIYAVGDSQEERYYDLQAQLALNVGCNAQHRLGKWRLFGKEGGLIVAPGA